MALPETTGTSRPHMYRLATDALYATAFRLPSGRLVVSCLGAVDSASAAALDTFLRELIGPTRYVVLDLSGVEHLGTAAIETLVAVGRGGTRVRVRRGRTREVHRALAGSGALTVLEDG
ncbi:MULTISPECIES: STAS domain-containing protein [Pseudonocardia]|nr:MULTISPECIES: STAS domain-containing protein [Pseudonocardia]BBF99191.1 hypothetical protein Pdca_04010 [Pseudonocardia autotrophica]GEC24737.1 hypothetical protein PSA01_17660 [Pseudonocardia saturnea]